MKTLKQMNETQKKKKTTVENEKDCETINFASFASFVIIVVVAGLFY